MVWSYREERKTKGLGGKMHVYGGRRCKAEREPRKTWLEVVKNDLKGPTSAHALDFRTRRRKNVRIVCHCGLVESARTCEETGCEFDSWQCQIYIISHVHRAYDYLGHFRVLWVHMA